MLSVKYAFDRAHYRLAYPIQERPLLVREDGEKEVVDISERGLRYRLSGDPAPELGAAVSGLLALKRGIRVEVEGEVVRVQDGEVALHLKGRGIPFALVWAEQRWLRSRYPGRFLG